jgi:hypothetical protein
VREERTAVHWGFWKINPTISMRYHGWRLRFSSEATSASSIQSFTTYINGPVEEKQKFVIDELGE